MNGHGKFKRGSGCFECSRCGKKTRDTTGGNGAVRLCSRCYDMSGDENAVADGTLTEEEFVRRYGVRPNA